MAENEIKESQVESAKKADEKKNVSKAKSNKPSVWARIARFWREHKGELKKIVWYSREQTIRSSVVVLVSIVLVGAVISGLDFCFSQLLTWLAKLI